MQAKIHLANRLCYGLVFLLFFLVGCGSGSGDGHEYEQVGPYYEFKIDDEVVYDDDLKNGSIPFGFPYTLDCKRKKDAGVKGGLRRIFISEATIWPDNNEEKRVGITSVFQKMAPSLAMSNYEKWGKTEQYSDELIFIITNYISINQDAPGGGYYYIDCTKNPESQGGRTNCRVYFQVLKGVRIQYPLSGNHLGNIEKINQCFINYIHGLSRPVKGSGA